MAAASVRLVILFCILDVAISQDSTSVDDHAAVAHASPPCKKEDTTPPVPEVLQATCSTKDPNCIGKEELVKFCNQTKGSLDGGRCYFSGSLRVSNWMNGWTVCAEKGGTMAQVHSSTDFEQLKLTLMAAGADQSGSTGQWIGLRRDPSANAGASSLDLYKTYWFDSDSKYDSDLVVGNTWIKTRQADDSLTPNNFCFITWGAGFNRIGGDGPCIRSDYGVACMKTTAVQSFKYVPKYCMIATPIKHLKSLTVDECSKKCAENGVWCRSFNYYCDKSCQLFSWISTDLTEQAIYFPVDLCKHYTYVS